jgi:hypothetical protein
MGKGLAANKRESNIFVFIRVDLRLNSNPCQRLAKPALRVSPAGLQFEAAAPQQACNGCGIELIAVLRMDSLALFKVEEAPQVLQPHGLLIHAFQVHFNA